MIAATVREWSTEEGWGVLDSAETPGGCWAHFSVIEMHGLKRLSRGQQVALVWETGRQDGYDFRAERIVPQ